ncbi:MAG TPA: NAD(P)/FAD-dependent oxidoreductase [Bacteroidia bacterium]|jgi:NADH dehydrogenase|nr:NAD(P)/FAD-dependent oxidoreductase [Bacteroidia bacterium]
MSLDIPDIYLKRVIIIGGGFAGIELAKHLKDSFQVVMIDRNNYHTFQPLLYQVATAGIEPDSIVFPLRKVFAGYEHFHFRMAEAEELFPEKNILKTNIGEIKYDHLIIASGSDTSYFGMEELRKKSMPMKSVREALDLRSCILENFEMAVTVHDEKEREALMTYVICGGGPTGVELAGALAELKRHVLPKDYPELDLKKMKIHLIDSGDRLLAAMGEHSSSKAKMYLEKMGVNVWLNARVTGYDGTIVKTMNGTEVNTKTLIWAAGVMGNFIKGIPGTAKVGGARIKVDEFNRIEGTENLYAVGDVAFLVNDAYPKGHPQVAQVAIQQGINLGNNLGSGNQLTRWKKFSYHDKGSMATIGRNKAVVETKYLKTQGVFAWLIWMFIHLLFLVGFRNRIVVFFNWLISYFNYDRGMRLIIRPFKRKE